MASTFDEAILQVRTLPSEPGPDVLLKLYGLFKQATDGDISGERPGAFNFKARAKYDAWASLKGMSSDNAKASYVALVNELIAKARR